MPGKDSCLMYTLLFALVLMSVLAIARAWPPRFTWALCTVTLALLVLSVVPHIVGREFGIAL